MVEKISWLGEETGFRKAINQNWKKKKEGHRNVSLGSNLVKRSQ
jgi:hypothetical protein